MIIVQDSEDPMAIIEDIFASGPSQAISIKIAQMLPATRALPISGFTELKYASIIKY
jgi:hypothetical protein